MGYQLWLPHYADIVTFLLSQGADAELADGQGHTSLDWTNMHGHVEVIQALKSGASH